MKYQMEKCQVIHQGFLRTILESLPEWFGIPSAIEEYVKESLNKDILCAYEGNQMVAFLTIKETSAATMEVYVMGIKKEYQRKGIGKHLIEMSKAYARKHKYQYIQVKTLSPEKQDPDYLKTYAFYESVGFQDVEVLPLWDEWNPCLLMIQGVNA